MTIDGSTTGGQWVLLHDTADSEASPTWVEQGRAEDVDVPLEMGEADVSRRECDWELVVAALKKGGISFNYVYKKGRQDPFFAALVDSFVNKKPLHMKSLDGPLAPDAFGFTAWMLCFSNPLSQKLRDGVKIPIVLKPTPYEEGGELVKPVLGWES